MTSAAAAWWIPAALAIVLALLIWVAVHTGAGTRVMPWGPPGPPRAGFARRAEIRALLRPRPSQASVERRPTVAAVDDEPPSHDHPA